VGRATGRRWHHRPDRAGHRFAPLTAGIASGRSTAMKPRKVGAWRMSTSKPSWRMWGRDCWL